MKKVLPLLIVLSAISVPAFAARKPKPPKIESTPAPTPSTGDFKVDKGLVAKIYEASVPPPHAEVGRQYGHNEISPQVGILIPTGMKIQNPYFGVDYTDQIAAVPVAHLTVAIPAFEVGQLKIFGVGRVGFSYVQGIYKARTQESNIEARDSLTLQWVPLHVGTKVEYRSAELRSFRPAFHLEGGTQYFSQKGSLDGIDQTFWAPFLLSGLSLTAFDQSDLGDNVFGGITLGTFYQSSFSANQTIRGWSLALGTRVVM